MGRQRSVSVSTLARYAGEPDAILRKADLDALRYGNKAHGALGKGPSLALFAALAIGLVIFVVMRG